MITQWYNGNGPSKGQGFRVALALACILMGEAFGARPGAAETCPTSLDRAIATVIETPQWERSQWGIVVAPLGDAPIYEHDAQTYRVPASNVKLLTTAAALVALGPDYQILTPIHRYGTAPTLTQLHISGRGDPSLTTADLQAFAQRLHSEGVREIQVLSVDDAPAHTHRPPTWEQADLNFYYGAAVNRVILNGNAFRVTLLPQGLGQPVQVVSEDLTALGQWQGQNLTTTVSDEGARVEIASTFGQPTLTLTGGLPVNGGSTSLEMAVLDPTAYFLDTFRLALNQAGITVGRTLVSDPPVDHIPQDYFTSPPLAALIERINQPSDNLGAEALLQQLGSVETATGILTALGVDPEGYRWVDGSGLSRQNLLSPAAVLQLLQAIGQHQYADVFRASLPLGGESGTLRNRFRNPALGVYAKTGTMTGISTLSGYLQPEGGEPWVFAVMLNGATSSVQAQRAAIDEVVGAIATWQTCQTDLP
ncbi:D-alanyl-D-alanine carboxypeptidase/D-alanyl-D-alanine-endopeptidase [Spirulina sp. CCNP1310]|uniref:D-alanyl-D-alanine carboxypeptidase/D-alanyl-D-alanine endopeptidase n=1 Tax=Spirulina sp. CCNP1310 TaxID=3110249 RepID=UPI002B21EF46|nr:D-alanyl-D-alanine carboxypeptidase/D-alanyl-D-alanine-endopeptidase [Spirulina sp. CCNP1310]